MKRMLLFVNAVLFIGCLCVSTTYASSPTTLKNIRVTESAATTQIIVELSKDVDYEDFELHSPERFVVDLFDVKLRASIPDLDLPPPLKAIRSNVDSKKCRLVIDLEHYVKPRVINADGNASHKLIIEIPRQGMRALSSSTTRISSFTKKIADRANEIPHPESLGISGSAIKNAGLSKTLYAQESDNLPKPGSIKAPKARDVVVVIDPGHGGKDPGARGASGTQEKDVVLAIAKRLQAQINRTPGFRAVLTREGDYYIGLRNRLALARKYRGDMFIAIHADAHEHLNACGVGVYALSQRGATSEAARWLAKQENDSELVGGVDLADKDQVLKSVLIDLSQTQSITASLQMGSVLLDNLGQFAQLHHSKVEQAAFVVLKSPDIPSLLIETGFISNSYEERRLSTPYYQNRIATALLGGIKNYFVKHPPRGSLLALYARKNYDT